MGRFILRRLAFGLITLFLLITVVFFATEVAIDDPGRQILGPLAPQSQVDQFNADVGADRPVARRYVDTLVNTATFNFGDSYTTRSPAWNLIGPALWRSAKLVAFGLLLTIPLSILGGVVAARRKDSTTDRTIVTAGLAGSAIPEFVTGVVLLVIFGLGLGWFPVVATAPAGSGLFTTLRYLFLPAVAIALVYFGYIARITRAGTIQAYDSDYVRTARMKGLGEREVFLKHVAKNGLQPTVAVIGTQVGYVFSGLIGLELVYNYSGLGRTILTAVGDSDIPVLAGGILIVGIIYTVFTLLADLVIAWMNPRIRAEVSK